MTDPVTPDVQSVAGKALAVAERTELLVVGAGPAGLAAAIAAAEAGLKVVLVDENPVDARTMGDDVPLHFGQAMTGAVRNRNAMTAAWAESEPALEAAFEAGVDVRLGTAAWGLYGNGPGVAWLPAGRVAGLVDGERSWLIGADAVVVAAGRRDMGLAFPGWDKPGVAGATAAMALATRYRAFAPRRVVVLGSSAEALLAAQALAETGVTVAAVIEQAAAPLGPAALIDRLAAAGTVVHCGHVVREAVGRDGVEAVLIAPVDAAGRVAGPEFAIACDGVVLAVGASPVVDLMDAAGCRMAFRPERGGWAPVVDADQRTSLADVFAVGDCAGIWPEKSAARAVAEAEARRAVAAVLALAGRAGLDAPPPAPEPSAPGYDLSAYRLGWVAASVVGARADCHVCQCEEVGARDILEVRPPRYLGAAPDKRNDRSLHALLGDGPPDPDQVKRLTRAGMGLCQGRRCREQVAALLALGGGVELGAVPLARHRAPVRPLPLALAGAIPEDPVQAAHWDSWFGMKAQWRPFWDVPPLYTVGGDDPALPPVSE